MRAAGQVQHGQGSSRGHTTCPSSQEVLVVNQKVKERALTCIYEKLRSSDGSCSVRQMEYALLACSQAGRHAHLITSQGRAEAAVRLQHMRACIPACTRLYSASTLFSSRLGWGAARTARGRARTCRRQPGNVQRVRSEMGQSRPGRIGQGPSRMEGPAQPGTCSWQWGRWGGYSARGSQALSCSARATPWWVRSYRAPAGAACRPRRCCRGGCATASWATQQQSAGSRA